MKNSAMKTVTVTRVGHPLPYPTTPGQATETTIAVCTEEGYCSFPSTPLSMLIRRGDAITLYPDRSLYSVNNLTNFMLHEYLMGFEGRIDRVSHPLWLKNPATEKIELCVVIAFENILCALKADWDTLLLHDKDIISLTLRNRGVSHFENYTLGRHFPSASDKLTGQIRRIAHPLACPDENGTPRLQTKVIMTNGESKIIPATPEAMFLQDGDQVILSDKGIINRRMLHYAYCSFPADDYQVKYISHPLPAPMPNGTKRLSRYLVTTENKLYRLDASEDNMLLQPGDKVIALN